MSAAQFPKFVLASGIAASVNLASRPLFEVGLGFSLAVVSAYLLGMATAFLLNRAFVFEGSRRSMVDQITRFGLVNLVSLGQVWLVSVVLGEYVLPSRTPLRTELGKA